MYFIQLLSLFIINNYVNFCKNFDEFTVLIVVFTLYIFILKYKEGNIMKIQPIISNIAFKGQPIIRHAEKGEPTFKGHPFPAYKEEPIEKPNITIDYIA